MNATQQSRRRRRLLPEGFFGPVEYATRSRYRRPPDFYRRLQAIAPAIQTLGLAPSYVIQLEVPGRRTGLVRRTCLVQVTVNGEGYLVSLAGESEWVRNVRAAAGRVVIQDRKQRHPAHLTEMPLAARAEVIRAYIHRPGPRGRPMTRTGEARHYFGVEPDATPDQMAAIAPSYPIFRIDPNASPYVGPC